MNIQELDAALIYCRVSSQQQLKDGSGLESQDTRCRYLAASHNLPVERVFSDSFTGGGDFMERPAMKQLIEYLDNNSSRHYAIIFDDLKRFARDLEFHWKLRKALDVRGAVPLCLNYSFDNSPEGRFIETVHAAHNQLEREQNKVQVRNKMKARLENGYWPFASKVFGYTFGKVPGHTGKVLQPVKPEIFILKKAIEGFHSRKFYHMTNVQKFLLKKNFNNGKPIKVDRIKRMLSNVLYAGYLEYEPWGVSLRIAKHKGITTLGVIIGNQEILDGKCLVRTRVDMSVDFPARGYVLCAECLQPLTASWSTSHTGKKYPYYRCGRNGCLFAHKSIASEKLHTKLGDLLKKTTFRKEQEEYLRALTAYKEDQLLKDQSLRIRKLEKKCVKIKNQIDFYMSRIEKTPDEQMAARYETQINKLSQKELLIQEKLQNPRKIQSSLEPHLKTVLQFVRNPYFTWENGGLLERQTLLQMLFEDKLVYELKRGFGTPKKTYFIRVLEGIQPSHTRQVEMDENSWNLITMFIQRWAAVIDDLVENNLQLQRRA